jgi:hypothetical protein
LFLHSLQRNRTVTATQEFLLGSPVRSLPVLVQFGHFLAHRTRELSFNRRRRFSWLNRGKSFTLGTTTTSCTSLTATVLEKTSLSGVISTGSQNENYSLAYQSSYDTAAALAEFSGVWSATLEPGVVNWTVGSNGALTGSRTTGCTYTGQVSLHTENKAVVTVTIAEACAGSVTQLTGVGALSSGKTLLGLVMTMAGEGSAVAVNLARQ